MANTDIVKLTGGKRKNGHKMDCNCHICENMKNAKGIKNISTKNSRKNSGKKSNGHKLNCGCPICKNMKKKKGGSDEDEIVGEPAEDIVKKEKVTEEEVASEDEYDALEETAKPSPVIEKEIVTEDIEEPISSSGGTRKRRGKGKKSNGHKPTCGCPICKNTRKGKKTRKHRRK